MTAIPAVASARLRDWLPWYTTLALIWGSSFAFIKLALAVFTPAGVALGRLGLGAVTLLAVMAVTRTPLPSFRGNTRPLFVGALLLGIPWLIFAVGQTLISSSLAGVISATTPMFALLAMLVAFREERPTRERMLGLVVGLLGVLVVVGVWRGVVTGTLIGIAACLLAVVGFGISYPFMQRHITGGPRAIGGSKLGLSAALLSIGAVQVLPFAAATGVVHAPLTTSAIVGILALGILGSGLAYVLNMRVIDRADATTASTVTYMNPVVALSWGVLLGESISWNRPVGAVLILLGAAMAQGLVRLPIRRSRSAAE